MIRTCWLVGLLVAGNSSTIPAQSSSTKEDLAAQIDEVAAPYVAAGDFMGVIAIQQDGESPDITTHGWAQLELDVAHDPAGVFMIGSVSKQFTAVAILLLEADGLLRVGDKVSRHLPGFGHADRITIEQLLTHTSGIPDVYSLRRFGETAGQGGNFADVMADLGAKDLTFEPGSGYAYSNGGYSVLAAIIEEVVGMTYGEFLKRRVFDRLGLSTTRHHEPCPVVPKRVPGYDPWGASDLTPVVPVASAYLKGSGSLWSSAADLLDWNQALHGGELLSQEAYQRFTRDYGNGYGYGVSVFRRFGKDVIGHDGRVAGYACDVARYVKERVTVVVLSNVQSVARDEIRRGVAAVLFGEQYKLPDTRTFRDPADLQKADYVGTYAFGPSFEVDIRQSGHRLLARANQGGSSELIPISESVWFSRMLYATVRFERDEAGAVDRLIWGVGDGAPVGQREG